MTPNAPPGRCRHWADRDEAFSRLECGLDERDYSMPHLKMQPNYDPLRGDPRFEALLRRMNFPE